MNGFQDTCMFSRLTYFNLVFGVAIDPMHCVYLGVTRMLLSLWFDTNNHKYPWYCGSQVETLEKQLLSIKPPKEVMKCPRGFKMRKYWKGKWNNKYDSSIHTYTMYMHTASEYRAWLLFYLLPCMEHVLPRQYLQHVAHLVKGVYLLSKSSINPSDLSEAKKELELFCDNLSDLYGMDVISIPSS